MSVLSKLVLFCLFAFTGSAWSWCPVGTACGSGSCKHCDTGCQYGSVLQNAATVCAAAPQCGPGAKCGTDTECGDCTGCLYGYRAIPKLTIQMGGASYGTAGTTSLCKMPPSYYGKNATEIQKATTDLKNAYKQSALKDCDSKTMVCKQTAAGGVACTCSAASTTEAQKIKQNVKQNNQSAVQTETQKVNQKLQTGVQTETQKVNQKLQTGVQTETQKVNQKVQTGIQTEAQKLKACRQCQGTGNCPSYCN